MVIFRNISVINILSMKCQQEYNLTIRVENNGAQQLASEATVFIVLEDVNDEIPLFTEREQVKSFSIFGGSINLHSLGVQKFSSTLKIHRMILIDQGPWSC